MSTVEDNKVTALMPVSQETCLCQHTTTYGESLQTLMKECQDQETSLVMARHQTTTSGVSPETMVMARHQTTTTSSVSQETVVMARQQTATFVMSSAEDSAVTALMEAYQETSLVKARPRTLWCAATYLIIGKRCGLTLQKWADKTKLNKSTLQRTTSAMYQLLREMAVANASTTFSAIAETSEDSDHA
jgi:hypothetical protein